MKKVLIVEKNEFTCEILAESLLLLSCTPVIYNFNQVLAIAFIEEDPDIVIIEQKIFLKNKHLFIRDQRKLSKAFIILTSNTISDPDSIEKTGADFFLLKPYDLSTLSEIVQKARFTNNL